MSDGIGCQSPNVTTSKKNWGLYVGKGLKRPCQHIDTKFRQYSTGKTLVLRQVILRKIIFSKRYANISGLDGPAILNVTKSLPGSNYNQ
jgi:hypothetical protein